MPAISVCPSGSTVSILQQKDLGGVLLRRDVAWFGAMSRSSISDISYAANSLLSAADLS